MKLVWVGDGWVIVCVCVCVLVMAIEWLLIGSDLTESTSPCLRIRPCPVVVSLT